MAKAKTKTSTRKAASATKRTTKAAKKMAPKRAATKKKAAAKKATSTKKRATKKATTKKKATKKTASGAAKASVKPESIAEELTPENVGDIEVTVDRRRDERRENMDGSTAEAPAPERRAKVARRRQIDPTTCERDYSGDEIEFMHALDEYKRKAGRMFPTCSEILEVVRDLGYRRLSPEELAKLNPAEAADGEANPDGEPNDNPAAANIVGSSSGSAAPAIGGAALAVDVDEDSEEASDDYGGDRFADGFSQGFDDAPQPSLEGSSYGDF